MIVYVHRIFFTHVHIVNVLLDSEGVQWTGHSGNMVSAAYQQATLLLRTLVLQVPSWTLLTSYYPTLLYSLTMLHWYLNMLHAFTYINLYRSLLMSHPLCQSVHCFLQSLLLLGTQHIHIDIHWRHKLQHFSCGSLLQVFARENRLNFIWKFHVVHIGRIFGWLVPVQINDVARAGI